MRRPLNEFRSNCSTPSPIKSKPFQSIGVDSFRDETGSQFDTFRKYRAGFPGHVQTPAPAISSTQNQRACCRRDTAPLDDIADDRDKADNCGSRLFTPPASLRVSACSFQRQAGRERTVEKYRMVGSCYINSSSISTPASRQERKAAPFHPAHHDNAGGGSESDGARALGRPNCADSHLEGESTEPP